MKSQWKEYLNEFERSVLIPIFEAECKNIRPEPVPLKRGKLMKTPFGEFVGPAFEYGTILSFNYYGLFKTSSDIERFRTYDKPATPAGSLINAPVIHFSSIKIEQIEEFNKELLLDFVSFKKFIVSLRWGK